MLSDPGAAPPAEAVGVVDFAPPVVHDVELEGGCPPAAFVEPSSSAPPLDCLAVESRELVPPLACFAVEPEAPLGVLSVEPPWLAPVTLPLDSPPEPPRALLASFDGGSSRSL